MNNAANAVTLPALPLTRNEARGFAFEVIDALGEAGALRFHEEHKHNSYAIMGLMDAMDDHGMSFSILPR